MFSYWPDNYLWSFQLVRLMGESHFGGGNAGEALLAASRIPLGDTEAWFREWHAVSERNEAQGRLAEVHGLRATARDAYLRAANYYRMADFFVRPTDPRKRPTYEKGVACFKAGGRYFSPPLEPVEIPYEGQTLAGYFFPARGASGRTPAVVFFGGADSTGEELYFTGVVGVIERGMACLVVDGPGQGSSLRVKGIPTRHDYEVPAAAALDYLEKRPEVDPNCLALMAYSMGGYYAPRAAAFEKRIRACIAWGGMYDYHELWQQRGEDHPMAHHFTWLLGGRTFKEAQEKARAFTLRGVAEKVTCPLLITHGEEDGIVPLSHAQRTFDEAGSEKYLKIYTRQEGGSAHCQYDHLPLAHAYMFAWLRGKLG